MLSSSPRIEDKRFPESGKHCLERSCGQVRALFGSAPAKRACAAHPPGRCHPGAKCHNVRQLTLPDESAGSAQMPNRGFDYRKLSARIPYYENKSAMRNFYRSKDGGVTFGFGESVGAPCAAEPGVAGPHNDSRTGSRGAEQVQTGSRQRDRAVSRTSSKPA